MWYDMMSPVDPFKSHSAFTSLLLPLKLHQPKRGSSAVAQTQTAMFP